jgi:magnesium chelatase subunit D
VTEEAAARDLPSGDTALACAMLAVDPVGLGGAVLHGAGGPVQDGWIASFRKLIRGRRIFKLPPHTGIDRLLGGIDVAATLKSGRPCHDSGLLAEANGGVLLLTSAERFGNDKAALIAAAMDKGEIASGGAVHPSRLSIIACDEGLEDDERTPRILTERVAFLIETADCDAPDVAGVDIEAAAALLSSVTIPDTVTEALCRTALALGIASVRPAVFALRAASIAAALDGRDVVSDDDAGTAARLVLAPRALTYPVSESEEQAEPEPQKPETSSAEGEEENDTPTPQELSEMLLEAVKASLPQGLLAALERELRQKQAPKSGAGAVSAQVGTKRGRPAGTRKGDPRHGARLNLIETLRAAAPWQRLRRAQAPAKTGVHVSREDFRINRYKQRRETTAIFVVDASGSAALHRMAEAKGAVELILADCYVRRDRTALIAFRGKGADVLLPPTRSLQRARRSLADLPGGGGTPMCAGIESAITVATQVRRGGGTPLIVFLTDGRANIARDGTPDRAIATRDAQDAARALRSCGYRSLMIDLSENRQGAARQLAEAMAATYLPLPHADAAKISQSVTVAMKV